VHSSTKSFSSSEETAVIPDDGLFNRKVEEEKIKEQSSPNPSVFSFPTPTAYCVPPNPTANLAPVAQGSREETRCCTARDQWRDAVERIGCDNTISRRAVRIYHGVATLNHHRIFRLLGERWHGVEVHRRKDTVRGHSPETNTNPSTENRLPQPAPRHHSPTFIQAKSRRPLTAKYSSDTFLGYHQAS